MEGDASVLVSAMTEHGSACLVCFVSTGVWPQRADQSCAPATTAAHCRMRGLLMVNGAERCREFVADRGAQNPRLGEADVMGVAW